MIEEKDVMTCAQLTEYVDALSSAVATQQKLNRHVYERIDVLEKAVVEIGTTQLKILDIMAGDSK